MFSVLELFAWIFIKKFWSIVAYPVVEFKTLINISLFWSEE